MAEQKTEMASMSVVRYSNEESKRITRECIETALIQLMEGEDFEKISISEIVKRAGVSRTAFYRNYLSKEDVLKSAVDDAITGIVKALSSDPHTKHFWDTLFSATSMYLSSFQLLLKAGQGAAILDQITGHLLSKKADASPAERYAEILWAGAVYNILVNWVKNPEREPVSEMAKICQEAIEIDHFGSRK